MSFNPGWPGFARGPRNCESSRSIAGGRRFAVDVPGEPGSVRSEIAQRMFLARAINIATRSLEALDGFRATGR